ncbi:MAG: polysaccharide deacetylase [Proteobacteria bacterium]|nr:polysaccharide deacetylase [Pseudomonadota bacterium]
MIDTPVTWPNGAKCAVVFSFDFDAETLWLGRDPSNVNRPGTLSQGAYGAKVGVPSILQVLRDMGTLPATFFVPGWTAEHHTDRVEAILRDGHEVAHHSYSHKWIEPTDPAGELEEMEKGLEALKRMVGVKPLGYRSPAGETSPNLFRLLVERGFLYDSSMMDGVNPYFHKVGNDPRALVEVPWHWSLDDAVFMLFSIKSPRAIMTNEHILTVWSDEFRAIYKAGGLFDLVMHPQVIGRPSRLQLLRDFIAFAQSFPNVWFATCRDVAKTFAAQAH